VVFIAALGTTALAQVPQLINYQGRVAVNGVNFEGPGLFRFALVDGAGANHWLNAPDAAPADGMPDAPVSLTVTKGLYSVLLGDATVEHMAVMPATVFTHPDVRLRVWFDDGTNGSQLLSPDQRIAAVGYAMMAGNVPDAAITSAKLAAGAVGSTQIANGAIGSAQLAAGAVATDKLASGAVTNSILADGAITANKMATSGAWTETELTTIINPVAVGADMFGCAVASVGDNRLLVGAYANDTGAGNAGAAYLFDSSGNLLTTFPNPFPGVSDHFGCAVAGLDGNRVLVGADYDSTGTELAGAAYLFSTDGTLITTFANPAPADSDKFGCAVAAVGSDNVLIGAAEDDVAAVNDGAAYLFDTDGTLLTTFANPTPEDGDFFGYAVAAVGTDRVLIGAFCDNTGANDAGAAYLFSLDGTLLATFTSPNPTDYGNFGQSVTALGNDRVLIGAGHDNITGTIRAGAAYLFGTDGTLLATFTSPTPTSDASFGRSVAAFGDKQLLIGAPFDDSGGTDTGAVYLFHTDGSLLAMLTNPTPASGDRFGWTAAPMGTDRIVVGAEYDDTAATNAGAAYLFHSVSSYVPDLISESVRAGAIGSSQLAPNLAVSGSFTAASFLGDGSGLTNIPASAVTGTIPASQIATSPPGMVLIPAGTFTMGDVVDGETNIVTVTLSAFYIAANEVTLSQWQAVYLWATSHGYTFTNSGAGKSANHPVHTVDWYDVVKWCNARSEMEGLTPCYYTDASQTTVYRTGSVDLENTWVHWSANGYRLPTEAEWEKAARGGLAGQRFPWGDTITQNLANYTGNTGSYTYDLGPDGYNALGNDGTMPYTTPVGTFAPNGYGLHDMTGNVFEWSWNREGANEAGTDPRGPSTGTFRVGRGSAWPHNA
jgi:formylglycine-generating enzyme required for sulfatase activity